MFSSTLFASTGSSLLGLWKSKSPQISNNNINNNNNNSGYISTTRHLNKVIAVSNADSDDTDDFIHIDIKKLSYAEVAAFNDTTHYSPNSAAGNGQEELCVINSHDLESTVSDYQMTNAMARNTKQAKTAKEAVIQEDTAQEDLTLTDSVVHDTHFNDKDTKRKKKMKKMKAKK